MYGKAIKNYVNFDGRASRREFWTFFLINQVIEILILAVIIGAYGAMLVNVEGLTDHIYTSEYFTFTLSVPEEELATLMPSMAPYVWVILAATVLLTLYAMFVALPSIAVAVRRFHDTDKSGWAYFVLFIPYIGDIIFLVLMAIRGTSGENKYGPAPEK
jgi:uncharacterized membrane protein YhaH (DUF805 family)